MFTGIITAIGRVAKRVPAGNGSDLRFEIEAPRGHPDWENIKDIPLGASIACAGCCLTVVETFQHRFAVEVSAETVSRTLLGDWQIDTKLNLERALKLGDELGGHIVSGHIDGLARLEAAHQEGGSLRLRWAVPQDLARFVAEKGSVALNGVSLTVNAVGPTWFGVNIIPHTAAMTTLGLLHPSEAAHIEIDMLARYVARLRDMERDMGREMDGKA